MKIALVLIDKTTGKPIEDYDLVMDRAGLDHRMRFEDIGIQADGTPVVFDKCGNFAYITDEYDLAFMCDR